MKANNTEYSTHRHTNSERLHQSLVWPPQQTAIIFTYISNSANRKDGGVFKSIH